MKVACRNVVTGASSNTHTSVVSSTSSVTLLDSNASRVGATVYNDSTSFLYLKLGAVASNTSYTIRMAGNSYYEVPFRYTGIIDGIWDSENGSARIGELT